MSKVYKGKIAMPLSKADAAGDYGYTLSFDYVATWDSSGKTDIKYESIEFHGPGSWNEYSEGDDYPYKDMRSAVLKQCEFNDKK